MRARTATWFETKIRYEKTKEDGLDKKVTEMYVVDALSFTEAENRIIEEMSSFISGEFKVTDIKKASYGEIFFTDAAADDKWYKAKLAYILFDEKTEKEKRTSTYFLVQASTLSDAVKHIVEAMSTYMGDYDIVSVAETQVMDVYERKAE